MNKEIVSHRFMAIQDKICSGLESFDGGKFREDNWSREGGGGGRSRVISSGGVFEKGGVNFSAVHGAIPPFMKSEGMLSGSGANDFFATGVSLVLHPENPFLPIVHMNVRYFETDNGLWWFGGGIDLTPVYLFEEDARDFHRVLKSVCDTHNSEFYPAFKKNADDYFFIPHRGETRGIGGIFFDRMNEASGMNFEKAFAFVADVGEAFLSSYLPLLERRKGKEYTQNNKDWQLLRRGRYVEFNLVLDRGTRFGLETGGRTESILMSLPPLAKWEYDFRCEPGSPEEFTLKNLVKGKSWV